MSSNRAEHKGNSRHSVIVPYRVGLLLDRCDQAHRDLHDALLLGIDEIRASGELDRDIIVDMQEAAGAPEGSVLDVVAAWRSMNADRMLMAMVGPFDDDNGAALLEDIESAAIPTLTYSPADDFIGRDVFQLPFGHPADVIHRLLDHVATTDARRIALVHEPTPRGRLLERTFREVVWQRRLGPVDTIVHDGALAAELRRLAPQALIYLSGDQHGAVSAALGEAGLSPLRLTGTEIIRAHPVFGQAAALDGWIGLDLVDSGNPVFRRFVRAFEERHRRQADHAYAAFGYDAGRVLGMLLAVVRPPSPLGVRNGLDTLRMTVSAVGAAGTVMSFARYDHRGYKGDPMLLATASDGRAVPLPSSAKAA